MNGKKVHPHLYEAIATEANIGIAVFDVTGQCLFINRVATLLLNSENPTLSNLTPEMERPPCKNFSTDLFKHDGLYQDIFVNNSMSGFIANVGICHLEFDSTSATLVMLQDVTLQKKLQREITAKQNEIKAAFEELLKQNQQLKELDIAKNRFIALTTHELRTPLSAMVASAEILKLKLYDTPEQMTEFIDMIYDQGLQLQDLVNDILDFAKIQAGKMEFFIEERGITPVTQGIAHNFVGMAETNQVKLEFVAPSEDYKCYFDEVRLRQVLSNMINNAIKYNRPSGSVRIYLKQDDEFVKVYVEDTGKGIAKDQFDKVFNEFETIGHVSQHHKGTGLGMPISRKLTEAMGGKLQFTSTEGVGSIFWVEIPRHKILPDHVYQSRAA